MQFGPPLRPLPSSGDSARMQACASHSAEASAWRIEQSSRASVLRAMSLGDRSAFLCLPSLEPWAISKGMARPPRIRDPLTRTPHALRISSATCCENCPSAACRPSSWRAVRRPSVGSSDSVP